MSEETFDYVVVGAGSAGAVVARRLVDAGASVALVEAGGGATNPAIADPGRSHELWFSPEDWGYRTDPQHACLDREIHWPRGRVLGGSSALNGMIYVRGHRADFDAWAMHGCPGWGYEDVLPFFKRSEDSDLGPSDVHGVGGPMRVISDYPRHPVNAAMVAASIEAGIPVDPDCNDGDPNGVGFAQLHIRDGRRESAASAFLDPIAGAERLTPITGATATGLRFDGERCVGVDAGPRTIRADGEVILCAGTIGSAELLLRSGIGPAGELGELGIAVRADLPGVGRNLHDHLVVPVIVDSPRPIPPALPGLTQLHSQLFWRSRSGLIAPDIQPLCFHVPVYDPTWMEGPADAYTLYAGLIRPMSRGALRLRSADPNVPPELDPRLLSASADVDVLVDALALVREIIGQPALREWSAAERYPGADVRSAGQLRDYVRRAAVSYHHQVGTCRMGRDAEAVVDPELRVHGFEGLRVADASVMPFVTSGNTAAATMMIGERAAELLSRPDSI
ncbi:MAG: GMC family oxidoreductase [Solirubrobacteraceae bacterium]